MELAALTLTQVDEKITAAETRFRVSLRKAVYAVAGHVLGGLTLTAADGQPSPDDASFVVQAWHDEVEGKLTPFVAALYYGAADAVNASLGGEVAPPDATDFLTSATNRIKALAQELWELIRLALVDGLRLGETSGQLAGRVQAIAKLSEARALTIARTEAHAALEAGALAQVRLAGLEGKKEWRATEDARTRPSHALADGQSVPLGEKYEVGGAFLDYPGDVTGPPGETINCRCTQLFHIVTQDDSMDSVDGDDATLVAAKKPFQESKVKRDTEGKFAKQVGIKVIISKLVASLKGYKKISGQKGSNLGGVYAGPTGDRIYVKRAKSEKHAKNEVLASALYRAAGIDTPQVHRATGAEGLPDTTVGQTYTDLVPGAVPDLSVKIKDPTYRKKVQEGFAVDAWLANWDVAGLTLDNVVTGDDGQPHRIDVGGTLLFRAQGAPKGAAFGDEALEIDTLRDPKMNPQAYQLFGDMTDDEIRESVKRVAAITPEAIDQAVADAGMDKSLAERLKKRRVYLMKRFGVPEPGEKAPTAGDATPFTIVPKAERGKSGDGYAAPGLWGRYGAAGVMIRHTDEDGTERFLLVQRGPQVSSNKGKWQLAGGAIDELETPEQGAAREIHEEIGAPADYVGSMKKVGTHSTAVPIEGKQPWTYSSVAADAPTMFDPVVDQTETGDAKWLTRDEIKTLRDSGQLHPALAKNIDAVLALYDGESKKSKPVSTPQLESLVEPPSPTPTQASTPSISIEDVPNGAFTASLPAGVTVLGARADGRRRVIKNINGHLWFQRYSTSQGKWYTDFEVTEMEADLYLTGEDWVVAPPVTTVEKVVKKTGPTLSGGAKKPKGKPGDPLKIITSVIWPKEPYAEGEVIAVSQDGSQKLIWNGQIKKYELQVRKKDIWWVQSELSKKEAYAQLKSDTGWLVPGGEPSPPPQVTNSPGPVGQSGDGDVGLAPWIAMDDIPAPYSSSKIIEDAGKLTKQDWFDLEPEKQQFVSDLVAAQPHVSALGLAKKLEGWSAEFDAQNEGPLVQPVNWDQIIEGNYAGDYPSGTVVAESTGLGGGKYTLTQSIDTGAFQVKYTTPSGNVSTIDELGLATYDTGDKLQAVLTNYDVGNGWHAVASPAFSPTEPSLSTAPSVVSEDVIAEGVDWPGVLTSIYEQEFDPETPLAVTHDGVYRLIIENYASNAVAIEKRQPDGKWLPIDGVTLSDDGDIASAQIEQLTFGYGSKWAPWTGEPDTSVTPTALIVTPSVVGDTSGISASMKKALQGDAKFLDVHWYSKPEAIWGAVKQIKGAHPELSYLQILHILDEGTKTKKSPTPHTDKIQKWLKTNKGVTQSGLSYAQIKEALGQSPAFTAPLTSDAEPPDVTTSGIGHLPAATRQEIYAEFKKLPSTSSAKGSPAAIFTAAKQVASDYNLSLLQVLQVLDEIRAAKLKQPGATAYQDNILAWLKTPKGAAAAAGLPIPKPEKPKFKSGISVQVEDFDTTSKYVYEVITTTRAKTLQAQAEQKHGSPADSAKAGVTAYTGGIYYSINSYLWGDTDALSSSNEQAMVQAQLAMVPSVVPMLLHRGTGYDGVGGAHSHAEIEGMVGQTWRGDGFFSTSVGGKAAFSGKPVLIEIEAPPGTPMYYAKPISHHPGENEMTLAAGLHYRIISVTKVGSRTVVRVRVVPEP